MSKTYVPVALRQTVKARAKGLCEFGEVTARILDFNHINRLIEREELAALRRYPAPDAFALISTVQS